MANIAGINLLKNVIQQIGADQSVLFNDSGNITAVPHLKYNKSTQILTFDGNFIQMVSAGINGADQIYVGSGFDNGSGMILQSDQGASFTDGIYSLAVNGGDAGSNFIGELLSAVTASASPVTLSTGTAANVVTLSLSPGDWDIDGVLSFTPGATTTTTYLSGGTGTTTATIPPDGQGFADAIAIPASSVDIKKPCPTIRLSLAITTNVYLVAKAGFAVSTLKAYGNLRARRMR